MYPQQTGWQQQPLYGQQTGFQQQQQQQPQQQGGFARPPLPPQASGQYSFLSAPPPSSSGLSPQQTGWQQPALRQQATGWSGAGLVPQATGWQGAGGQQQQPLMPQATGWHDPRLQMMQSSFMPMNTSAPFQSGVPVFQQPTLPAGNLQSSMNLLNQTPSVKTPKIPWALTKDERKNYDQIFRAWDKDGSGFISGEMAREVFGQSGLGQDDMAQIWTLADMDNRGKLNIQEFHVAMALIYRRLNGNDMPAVLPAELVPASSKDLDSNVDFLKSLLRNDTNSRSTSTELSYAKTRSFNDASPAGGERKKDGTVYKHDEDRELGKTYKSSSRHLDRSSVRTGKESASDDLAQIKRDLANTSSRLDDRLEERGRRDEEDELLDEEMNDLKRRVRRIKDDIEYVSSGRPTSQKDEERRKLERELLHIAHEKIPDVERRIEEREERKKREDREGVRARDRRNDRYGGRYEDRGDDDDRDRGYRGSYDRDDRDYRDRNRDRSRDRYDSYSSSSRDRPRSPPPAPAPPAHSLAAPAAPPAPPKPTASPAPAGQTREQRLAEARARALQKLEDRKRALGLGSAEPEVPTVDSSVSERIEREKREAEEAGKRAEEERAKKEADRRARLEAEKGGPAKPASAPLPAPPALPAGGAPAVAPKAAPPPPKPRSILKSRAPAPPPSKAGPSPAVQEATQDEEDPVERQLRERETRLKKSAADRATRLAALEAEEEEERKAEEALHARRQQAKSSAASTPPAPKSPEPSPALAVPAVAVAQASTSPSGGSLGAHNPFAKFSAVGGAGSSAAASPAAPDAARFFKPPTQTFTPPPMAAPVAKAPTKKFVPTPADDEDWDVIEDKGNESDSSDDYDTAKRRKAELAKALFGGIMPSSSPAPSSNPPSAAPTPAPAAASASPTDSAPPKNPMLAALGGGSAEPAARGGLFAAIQGGAKLKKAVTVDKSSPAVTGAVVGDAAPPAHISDVLRAVSPPPSPPADTNRAEPTLANANRQSVDWYAGLAANAPSGASAPTSLPAQVEEDEEEDAHTNRQGSQAPVGALDGVDMSVSLRVRTLFSYDGQRPEDLSFTENVMIDAHPATDPESPWYYGMTIKDRKSGWFPSSYVADVADVVQAKALYSYTGSSDQELPFVEGDVLTIVEHTDDSWWKAVSDGIVFLVPAAYLELQG